MKFTFDAWLVVHVVGGAYLIVLIQTQKTPIQVRRDKRELPEAFFGDSQEEKDTVRPTLLRK